MERIELLVETEASREAFTGRWLVTDFESEDPQFDAGTVWNVALTDWGGVALYVTNWRSGPGHLHTFDSIDDMEAEDVFPEDLLGAVRAELDPNYVQELTV